MPQGTNGPVKKLATSRSSVQPVLLIYARHAPPEYSMSIIGTIQIIGKKYVTRERNKENNREVFVAITPTASQALAKCESEYASANLCTQLPLNAAEQKTLLELLTKLSQ